MSDLLNLLASHRKMEALQALTSGVMDKRDLRDELGISSSSLAQISKDMLDMRLIDENSEGFRILPKGRYLFSISEALDAHSRVLEKFGEHVNRYDISDIPDDLVARMNELEEMQVLERHGEIYLPHSEFLEVLENSSSIQGFTSVFFPEYVDAFLNFASEGKEISIIVTEDILRSVVEEYGDRLVEGLGFENVDLFVTGEDFKLSFVVADDYFTLSLFTQDGFFDFKKDFVTTNERGQKWGRDLFRHVRERSRRLEIEELMS